jgi:hypothetical protein
MTEPWANPFQTERLYHFSDFRPDWDVPSLHVSASNSILDQIRRPRSADRPDPEQKVQVLLGSPGIGKTHLLARLAHSLGDEALVVDVPAFEDATSPLEHVRWQVVEALFLRMASGQFVGQGPKPESGIVIPFKVIEFLAEGRTVVGSIARLWLRGDSLSERETRQLGVPNEPLAALDVLRQVPAILGGGCPLVLCFDQFEQVLNWRPEAIAPIVEALLKILDEIPNLILVVSCSEPQWSSAQDSLNPVFVQRLAEPCKLQPISELQAVELVGKRLSTAEWREHPVTLRWPLDEAGLLHYLVEKQPTPRLLLSVCRDALQHWLEGDRSNSIVLGDELATDLQEAFLPYWHGMLKAVQADALCQPANFPEGRLFRAVAELLRLAQQAKRPFAGAQVQKVGKVKLKKGDEEGVSALRVDSGSNGQATSLLVLPTTINHGDRFSAFFSRFRGTLDQGIGGALLIHRTCKFAMNDSTREKFEELRASGKLRLIGLDGSPATFATLEALLRVLDDAAHQRLVVAGVTVSPKDCQDLLLKTSALDKLDLFATLAAGQRAAVAAAKPPIPRPSRAPHPARTKPAR